MSDDDFDDAEHIEYDEATEILREGDDVFVNWPDVSGGHRKGEIVEMPDHEDEMIGVETPKRL